jgi:hypothetical protein
MNFYPNTLKREIKNPDKNIDLKFRYTLSIVAASRVLVMYNFGFEVKKVNYKSPAC